MLLSLALILICGFAASGVLQKLHLPPLLGMMVVGMVLGPHGLGLIDPVLLSVSSEIRQVALIVVLIRAGLSLELGTLRRVGRPALLLCFLPSTAEIITITLLAPVLLGIPVIQAAVLGAVLAAVSPAVVVPRMLQLTEQGYGAQQGVPQMVMTGAAVDDVYVVVLFTALLRMAQGGGFAPLSLLQVPLSILLGLLLGAAGGQLAAVVFCRFHLRDTVKVLLLLALSFVFVSLEAALKPFVPVSGLLAVVTMGALLRKKTAATARRVAVKFSKVWVGAEPVLFVLVGAAVDLGALAQSGIAALGVILAGLLVRAVTVLCCTAGRTFNLKQRLFAAVAYLPKATVQAALAGLPLAAGLSAGGTILTVAVLAILVAAPLGAVGIDRLGTKLLPPAPQPGAETEV